MRAHQGIHWKSVLLGAGLVMIGFLFGSAHESPDAAAQVVVREHNSPFMSKRDALITSSSDGTTLHFWSLAPANSEQLNPASGFFYQGSRAK